MFFVLSPGKARCRRSHPRISIASARALVLLCMAPVFGHSEEGVIPQANSTASYEQLKAHSPFAVATSAPPATPQASFAANWFVSGIARIGDQYFVSIQSRDLGKQFTLYGTQEVVDGVALAGVIWSDLVGKSTVTLRKGNETAKLEFNEAQIHGSPGAAAKPVQANGALNAPANAKSTPPPRFPAGPANPNAQPPGATGGKPAHQGRTQVIIPEK